MSFVNTRTLYWKKLDLETSPLVRNWPMGQRQFANRLGTPFGGAMCSRPHPDRVLTFRSPKVSAFEQTRPEKVIILGWIGIPDWKLLGKLSPTREPKWNFWLMSVPFSR